MATGFMQRFKGRIQAAELWLGGTPGNPGVQVTASGGDLNTNLGAATALDASTAALVANGYGMTKIPPTAGLTYALGAPVAGRKAILYTTDIGLGARKISSTAAGATFQSTLAGAAFLNLSTIACDTIELIGQSSVYWLIGANRGAATVSTS